MTQGSHPVDAESDPLDVQATIHEAGAGGLAAPPEPVPQPIERIEMGGPAGAPRFEFSPHDEHLIADLGRKMRFVGVVMLLLAVVFGVALPIFTMLRGTNTRFDLGAVVYGLLGFWTLAAGIAFRDVAHTQGRDIPHLMHALAELRRSFTLIFWLMVAVILASVAILAWNLLQGFGGMDLWLGGRHIIVE